MRNRAKEVVESIGFSIGGEVDTDDIRLEGAEMALED